MIPADPLETNKQGMPICDPNTGETSVPGVFVAGDLAYGAKLLIHAVASGKRVARHVYQQLTGIAIRSEDTELHFPIPGYAREPGYECTQRVPTRTVPVRERLKAPGVNVEIGYDALEARREASRCLDCGVNTIFDGGKCILCGGCVDVCPQQCLRIVPVLEIANYAQITANLSPCGGPDAYSQASAILKDETICIRCGLCAQRCPVEAITMERFQFQTVHFVKAGAARGGRS